MPFNIKNLKAHTHDAEVSAALHISHKPWCIPNVSIRGGQLWSEHGRELYAFTDSVTSHVHAARILSACFTLMDMMHADNVYHLDCHPKNMILCKTIREGAVVVDLDESGVWGLYVTDFETLYHPQANMGAFEAVTDAWNSSSTTGLGRMPFAWYRDNSAYSYDVYTFSTYIIKYVHNPRFVAFRSLLYYMCCLDSSQPLPFIETLNESTGTSRPYYTYLPSPRNDIKTAREGAEIFKALSKSLDTIAGNNEYSGVNKE